MAEVFEAFSVRLPLVALEELQQVDAALRDAEAVFTYQIGFKEYSSFAALPLGESADELRIVALVRVAETLVPLASLCVRGDSVEAQLHEESVTHQLWFTKFRCALLERAAGIEVRMHKDGKGITPRVRFVCHPDLVEGRCGEPAVDSKSEVANAASSPKASRTKMWVAAQLWGLLGPFFWTKLLQMYPGGLPSLTKAAEVGTSLFGSSGAKG